MCGERPWRKKPLHDLPMLPNDGTRFNFYGKEHNNEMIN